MGRKNDELEYYDVDKERKYIYKKIVRWSIFIVSCALVICLLPESVYKKGGNWWGIIVVPLLGIGVVLFGYYLLEKSKKALLFGFLGLVGAWLIFYFCGHVMNLAFGAWVSVVEVLAGLIGIALGFWIDRRYTEQLRILDKYEAYRAVLLEDIQYIRTLETDDAINNACKLYTEVLNIEGDALAIEGSKKSVPIRDWGHYFIDEGLYINDAFLLYEQLGKQIAQYYARKENADALRSMSDLWMENHCSSEKDFNRVLSNLENCGAKGQNKIKFVRDHLSSIIFILQNVVQFETTPIRVDTFDDILDSVESMSLFFNLPQKDKQKGKEQNKQLGKCLHNIDKSIKYINRTLEQKEKKKNGLNICILWEYSKLHQNLGHLSVVLEGKKK